MTAGLRELQAERARAGMLGLIVGDALGKTFEFRSARDIPPAEEIKMVMPPSWSRSHPGIPDGTYTDDSAQALCLLASLLARKRVDLVDFGARLVRWQDEGYMAVDADPFDIGSVSSGAIANLRVGVPPPRSGLPGDSNGALMRTLPLALWWTGFPVDLDRAARAVAHVTHADPRVGTACARYCVIAYTLRMGGHVSWIETPAGWEERSNFTATGAYACAVRSVNRATSYAEAVRAAVREGGDTDTTAAIAGGLAGVRYAADDVRGVPATWADALRGRELFEPWIDQLAAHVIRA